MLRSLTRMLILDPNQYALYRVKAHLLAMMECYAQAADTLETYLQYQPHASDRQECLKYIEWFRTLA